jgi:hypothetical protein
LEVRSTSSSGCRGVDLGHLVEFLADDLAGVGLGALLEPPIEDQLPAFQYGAARGSGSAALSSFPRLGFEAEIGLLLCIGANVRVGRVFERRLRDIHTLVQQSSRGTPITKPPAKSSSAIHPRCFL